MLHTGIILLLLLSIVILLPYCCLYNTSNKFHPTSLHIAQQGALQSQRIGQEVLTGPTNQCYDIPAETCKHTCLFVPPAARVRAVLFSQP